MESYRKYSEELPEQYKSIEKFIISDVGTVGILHFDVYNLLDYNLAMKYFSVLIL